MALRIITDSVKNCYAALGVIHNEWRPIPGRIKDFIAIPRPNLYQSLHTSRGGPARADVRGADPHRGDAPHRRGRHRGALEVQGRPQGPGRRRSAHRLAAPAGRVAARGAGPRRVHVHPEGGPVPRRGLHLHAARQSDRAAARRDARSISRTRSTPTSATPASARRSTAGSCRCATSLRNGDIVEILTQPGHEPSKDWLAFVKTSRARNKIKHVINASERVKAIEIGQKYLEKEARRLGVQLEQGHQGRSGSVCVGEYGLQQDRGPVRGARLRQVLRAPGAAAKLAPGRGEGRAPEPRPPPADAGAAPRRARGERRRRRHQGPRHRRPAGLPRQVLQSDPRRGDRRLRHARQGRRGAFARSAPTCRT